MEVTEKKRCVLVVLDGYKLLPKAGKAGLSVLLEVLEQLMLGPGLEVMVMVILKMDSSSSTLQLSPEPSASHSLLCCMKDSRQNNGRGKAATAPAEGDNGCEFVNSMHQAIGKRRWAFREILYPYYETCKTKGVKFQVIIAAGCQLQTTIEDVARRGKASRIFMDSCFSRDLRFRLRGVDCGISIVNNNETASVNFSTCNDTETHSINRPKADDGSDSSQISDTENCSHSPIVTSTIRENEINEALVSAALPRVREEDAEEQTGKLIVSHPSKNYHRVHEENIQAYSPGTSSTSMQLPNNIAISHQPLLLSLDEVKKITNGFEETWDHTDDCTIYSGNMIVGGSRSPVLVHKLMGDTSKALKAEKKVSSTMYHKNIYRLVGYHQSENATFLVFPSAKQTLDRYVYGSRRKMAELTFHKRVKIAIEIAQAIRYMHEEYPRGPVVHRDIKPCSIYIGQNFQPQVSGFKQAKWQDFEQAFLVSDGRSLDPSDCEVMKLMKADVYSYGVLLLRLFCQRPIPRDDKKLIEWARPLMIQRNFCAVLGEGAEKLDTHEVYKVMCITTRCTVTRPILRPSMSEVVWTLKGEIFCEFELSQSEGSEESPDPIVN